MTSWRAVGTAAPIVALALVPAVVGVTLWGLSARAESDALTAPEPHTVLVGSAVDESRQQAEAVVRRATATPIESGATGVLTTVNVRVGDNLAPALVLATVNDRALLSYPATVPMYRDLAIGDRGDDVTRFQEFLRDAGYDIGEIDGYFGARTSRALTALQREKGLIVESVARQENFVWIPPGVTTAGTVTAQQGSRVDPGSVLFFGPAAIETLTIRAPKGSEPLTFPDGTELAVAINGDTLPLTSLTPTGSEADDVARFLSSHLTEESQATDNKAGTVTLSGFLVFNSAAKAVATVPARALYATGSATCVFTVDGAGYRSVRIADPHLISGTVDALEVPDSLRGESVALAPARLSATIQDTCGSK